MAQITYYSLSDYNNGILIPFTIVLDGQSYEEHLEAIQEYLEEITDERNDGELREEYIVCDYEDIPSRFVGEWSIDEEYFEMNEAMNSSCLDKEAFMAGVELGISYDRIEDAYYGQYASDTDFAWDILETTGEWDAIPAHLQGYFDVEAYASDLMISDFDAQGGFYFSTNY